MKLHAKPIVLVNVKNYYAPLIKLIDHFVAEGFAGAGVTRLYEVAPTVEEAIKIFVKHRAEAVRVAV